MRINKLFCTSAIFATVFLSSCGSDQLELKYNNWTKLNQSEFWKHIDETYEYFDFYALDSENREQTSEAQWNIHTPAQAIIAWTYNCGGAFTYWATELHNGRDPEEMKKSSDKQYICGGIPDASHPKVLDKYLDRWAWSNLKDFVWLDDALSQSTTNLIDGKKVVAYHGYEYNETEMVSKINEYLGVDDFLNLNPSDARSIDVGSKLTGKTIIDNSWCATTVHNKFAWDWTNGQDALNVPVYTMTIDPSVKSTYVSSTNKKYFDGIYLAWPHEYQLLLERNLKFTITDAWWQSRPWKSGNFLNICVDVTRNI